MILREARICAKAVSRSKNKIASTIKQSRKIIITYCFTTIVFSSIFPSIEKGSRKKMRELFFFRIFAQEGVRRTNFDKKTLIDKYFACRRADSHRFGATHSLFFFKSESPIFIILSPLTLPNSLQRADKPIPFQ